MEFWCFVPYLIDAFTVSCSDAYVIAGDEVVSLTCNDTVSFLDATTIQCSSEWVTGSPLVSGDKPFDVTELDPVLMSAYIGSGFFILLPLWAGAYGVKALLQTIKSR